MNIIEQFDKFIIMQYWKLCLFGLANQSLKSLSSLNSIFDTVASETTDKIKCFYSSKLHLS